MSTVPSLAKHLMERMTAQGTSTLRTKMTQTVASSTSVLAVCSQRVKNSRRRYSVKYVVKTRIIRICTSKITLRAILRNRCTTPNSFDRSKNVFKVSLLLCLNHTDRYHQFVYVFLRPSVSRWPLPALRRQKLLRKLLNQSRA